MSEDEFASSDAAYVLGALSPEDRHAFEVHLRTCASCTASVQAMAGLPGLLARADPTLPVDPPMPDLLPALLRRVTAARRRRRLLTGSGWLAAAACAAALIVLQVFGPAASTPAAATPAVAMQASPGSSLSGQIALTGVAWGTKLELKCTYPSGYADTEPYLLVVYDRAGHVQQVGSWKVLPGRTSTMNASTDVTAADIGRVEVQSITGSTVLYVNR